MSRRNFRILRALEGIPFVGGNGIEGLTLRSGRRVRLHRPRHQDGPTAALLWIHGGGYVIGKPQQGDGFCRRLSRKLGITIAAPSYRLAPEHPYPAALHDLYAALKWLATLPGVDESRIAVGGESAGGGLAAALALLARDRGEIAPALQLLSYPMLDDRTTAKAAAAPSYRLWNEHSNRFGWASYLGDTDPEVAVPARRRDLSGLPPAWIGVGTADLFYDEDVAYAERLEKAGVPCRLEVIPGGFHGFDRIVARASVSRRYFESECTALRHALA